MIKEGRKSIKVSPNVKKRVQKLIEVSELPLLERRGLLDSDDILNL